MADLGLGTFYYPWLGGNPIISGKEAWRHWKSGGHTPPKTWASNYLPDVVGIGVFQPFTRLYSSKDVFILMKQLYYMKKAGINYMIVSWWGQGSYEDEALKVLDAVLRARGGDIKFTIYYEKESLKDVPQNEIVDDINYIKNNFANSPAFLKANNKPVIFVYNTFSINQLATAQKWSTIKGQTGIYTVLKVFENYQTVSNLADGWHQYIISKPFEQQGNFSAAILPGHEKYDQPPKLPRVDFARFETSVQQLKNASVPIKLVVTWNEWGEASGVEPAQRINHDDIKGFTPASDSYGTKYIDILGKYFNPTGQLAPVDILLMTMEPALVIANLLGNLGGGQV